jgi:hypothetical protein
MELLTALRLPASLRMVVLVRKCVVDIGGGEVKVVRNRLRVETPFFDQCVGVADSDSSGLNVGFAVNF